jgi:PAS domain S-box-containing protein
MYNDFFQNIVFTGLFCMIGIWLSVYIPVKWTSWFWGVVFGLCTVITMKKAIVVSGGMLYDFRHVILPLGGFVGGGPAILLSSIIAGVYRLSQGGIGAVGGTMAVLTYAGAGYLLKVSYSKKNNSPFTWFFVGLLLAALQLILVFIYPPWGGVDKLFIFNHLWLPSMTLTPVVTTLLFCFFLKTKTLKLESPLMRSLLQESTMNLIVFNADNETLFSSNSFLTAAPLRKVYDDPGQLLKTQKRAEGSMISLGEGLTYSVRHCPLALPNNEVVYIALLRDESLFIQQQEQLRISNERFSHIFEASPAGIMISRKKDNVIIDMNQSFTQIMGYGREEAIGSRVTELFFWHKFSDAAVLENLFRTGLCKKIDFKARKQDGQIIDLLGSLKVIKIDDEEYILTVFDDITEKKQAEREIARLDRLKLIGQMAAGIGHEVRNPLTTVKGFLQLLSGKPKYKEEINHFNLMISELDRANEIITKFLTLAGSTSDSQQLCNLNQIIENLFPLLQADAFKNDCKLDVQMDPIPDLYLDKNEIHQMLLNLVRNGFEAMQTGGFVTIKTFDHSEEVVLAIGDEGGGIDVNILEKLGMPFLTTKREGTGLGLATCFSIAKRHSARIEVETSPKGTTFYLRFLKSYKNSA